MEEPKVEPIQEPEQTTMTGSHEDSGASEEAPATTEPGVDFPLIVEVQKSETVFDTPKGTINVLHEITLGDVMVTMLLAAVLIFNLLDRVIRR